MKGTGPRRKATTRRNTVQSNPTNRFWSDTQRDRRRPGEMDGDVLGALACMVLVFSIFALLIWRRRSDAATADSHRLPPQPLQADRVVHRGAAPRSRMRRRPAAAGSSAASTSRDGNDAQAQFPGVPLVFWVASPNPSSWMMSSARGRWRE
jgi:hypothetical protein